jgi:serine/threonine-protein kinase
MIPEKISRYEIVAEIGRGGMATVYHAYDPRFKRDVAIKVLPRQFTHDPMFRTRFEREAQTIAALEHPAIVPVYDFGEQDEQPYLVMRYMTGGSLVDRVKEGPLPPAEATRIITRLAPALDEAHKQGIVHRDLKPGNILFDKQGNPYLADFGIAKLVAATSILTGSALIGTPAYMSPEQAKGGQPIDGRSDLYALGVILFEMLTGQVPYQADTPVQVIMRHIMDPVPRILTTKPDLPPGMDPIITTALAKEADSRYSTAEEMARALTSAIQPPSALISTLPPSLSTPRRRWLAWVIGALLVLAILIGNGLRLLPDRNDSTPPTLEALTVITAEATVMLTATELPPSATATIAPAVLSESDTATPRPTHTPVPTASAELRVTVNSVNLRNGPGTAYRVIGSLQQGDTVLALAKNRDGSWYNVELENGNRGWLAADFSEPVNEAAMAILSVAATIPALPTATATNTPTNTPVLPTPQPPPAEPPPPTIPPPTIPPPTATFEPPPPTETPCPYPECAYLRLIQ